MKISLLVFLGNPGPEYARTRHNVAWLFADELVHRGILGAFAAKKDFRGDASEGTFAAARIRAIRPTTWMNLSGGAVRAISDFYRIPPSEILVVSDEVQLPVGKLKLDGGGGSAGGHNGLRSLISTIGPDFLRLRLGIGPRPAHFELRDFVLGRFTDGEEEALRAAFARAGECLEILVRQDLPAAQTWGGSPSS